MQTIVFMLRNPKNPPANPYIWHPFWHRKQMSYRIDLITNPKKQQPQCRAITNTDFTKQPRVIEATGGLERNVNEHFE
jgi:hypothetical protein